MTTFILGAIVLAALGLPLLGAFRALLAALSLYRRRIALLHTLQRNPDTPVSVGPGSVPPLRQNYVLTGALVIVAGLAAMAFGHYLYLGTYAVGLYLGGSACVGLGVILSALGYFIASLRKHAASPLI